MILSPAELLDAVIMTVCIGYIFSRQLSQFNIFRKPKDYVSVYALRKKFIMSDFLFSISLVAPAILLHELGHKFIAIAFGYSATFHSPISIQHFLNPFLLFTDFFALLMVIAVISTYFGGAFVFFVPAYVEVLSHGVPINLLVINPFVSTLVSFAGPLVNLILWQGGIWLINSGRLKHKHVVFAVITSKINKLLFIFNMIPIPGFDGNKVLSGLLSMTSMIF